MGHVRPTGYFHGQANFHMGNVIGYSYNTQPRAIFHDIQDTQT